MNKKLIALAVAAAAIPTLSLADVVIYGKIKAGVENTKEGEAASKNLVEDYGSRIGFKGTEDLGNGLKALWQVESKIAVDSGEGTSFGTRQSFLGMEGSFGKVRLGYINNSLNDLGLIDLWEYNSDAQGLSLFTRTGYRLANSVRYDSPDFGGVKFNVGHGVDEERKDGNNRYTTYAGIDYNANGIFASYAYQRNADQYGDNKTGQVHRVEAGYDANNLFVGLGYQQTKGNFGWLDADEVKTREAALTVGYTMGAFTPKFSLAKGWNMKEIGGDTIDNSDYKQYVVGVDYAFSKRTVGQLSYGKLNFDGKDDDVRTVGFNVVHSF